MIFIHTQKSSQAFGCFLNYSLESLEGTDFLPTSLHSTICFWVPFKIHHYFLEHSDVHCLPELHLLPEATLCGMVFWLMAYSRCIEMLLCTQQLPHKMYVFFLLSYPALQSLLNFVFSLSFIPKFFLCIHTLNVPPHVDTMHRLTSRLRAPSTVS